MPAWAIRAKLTVNMAVSGNGVIPSAKAVANPSSAAVKVTLRNAGRVAAKYRSRGSEKSAGIGSAGRDIMVLILTHAARASHGLEFVGAADIAWRQLVHVFRQHDARAAAFAFVHAGRVRLRWRWRDFRDRRLGAEIFGAAAIVTGRQFAVGLRQDRALSAALAFVAA